VEGHHTVLSKARAEVDEALMESVIVREQVMAADAVEDAHRERVAALLIATGKERGDLWLIRLGVHLRDEGRRLDAVGDAAVVRGTAEIEGLCTVAGRHIDQARGRVAAGVAA
jgi:hypothetical protein